MPRTLPRIVGAVIPVPLTCLALCSFSVEPVHGWMMRHHCPIAMLTKERPSHPMSMP